MFSVRKVTGVGGALGFLVGAVGSGAVVLLTGSVTVPLALGTTVVTTLGGSAAGLGGSTAANYLIQKGRDEVIPEAVNAIKKRCWEAVSTPPIRDFLIGASSILAAAVWLPLVNSAYGVYSTLLFNSGEQPSESVNQTAIALTIVGLGVLVVGVGECCLGGYRFLSSSKQGGSVKKA